MPVERLTLAEALRRWRKLIAAARKRGGTHRGEVNVTVVDGRRLS